MELQLKNIGMIKEANVKIDGLTVIAGENDTGKSTVGKVLFSIIKAISRYKEDLEESKEEKIYSYIEKNYFQLRREVDFSKNLELRKIFFPPTFIKDIEKKSVIDAIENRLINLNALREQSLFIEKDNKELELLKKLEKKLLKLKTIALTQEDKTEIQKRAFNKVVFSEFKGKITNQNTKKSFINITEGGNQIFDVKFLSNKINEFKIFDKLYFADATFIESPILLQLADSIEYAKTYFEESDNEDFTYRLRGPNVALHIKDFDNKVKESAYAEEFLELEMIFSDYDTESILDKLSGIIDGKIKYNRKIKDFIYTSSGKDFNSLNTATGIKTFGIIQMLVKTGYISPESLLILDEPEVHLHPKWQIEFAKLITELVKNNITVVVTSHSPYMIQALIKYARDNEDVIDKSNFYLAQKENNFASIENVNDNLNKIFELLAKPMNEIFEL